MEATYTVWMRWRLEHDYYPDGICRGMELELSPRSRAGLKKRDLLFRKAGPGEWCLLGNERSWCDGEEIELLLNVTDRHLFFATSGEIGRVYPFALQQDGSTVVVGFKAKSLVWEYILFARPEREFGQLELADATGGLVFGEPEEEVFMGRQVLKTLTTTSVPLREDYDYQLRLYEQKPLGRKMICSRVLFPVPGGFVKAGEGCIRQVVYF